MLLDPAFQRYGSEPILNGLTGVHGVICGLTFPPRPWTNHRWLNHIFQNTQFPKPMQATIASQLLVLHDETHRTFHMPNQTKLVLVEDARPTTLRHASTITIGQWIKGFKTGIELNKQDSDFIIDPAIIKPLDEYEAIYQSALNDNDTDMQPHHANDGEAIRYRLRVAVKSLFMSWQVARQQYTMEQNHEFTETYE